MGFHDTFDDGETDAVPASAACLPESIEDLRQMLFRDARSAIRDPEDELVISQLAPNREISSHGCELDRIADEVREDLQQTLVITQDGCGVSSIDLL
ncbi:MAG: hypothetical protein WEE89_09510 [Gemmatimonadota bacterium]